MMPRRAAHVLLLFTLALPLRAQTLAHRNWAGSGLTVDTWWNHAVLYQIDPISFQDSDGDGFGDLRGITARLDYLQSLTLDALLLSPLEPSPDGGAAFNTAYGSEDDFNRLIDEASRHRIRILVDLPLSSPNALALARFWLTRGVAGLRLTGSPAAMPAETLTQLRRLVASYPGNRILLNDVIGMMQNSELSLNRTLTQATSLSEPMLRSLLASLNSGTNRSQTVLAADSEAALRSLTRLNPDPQTREATARLLATVLFTSRAGVLLLFGQEIGMASLATSISPAGEPTPMQWGALPLGVQQPGAQGFTSGIPWLAYGPNAADHNVAQDEDAPGSLLNFYRALSSLHHGNPALSSGTLQMLSCGIPGVLAWMRRPAPGKGSPVLVLLNLNQHPVTVSAASLGLHAEPRTLLRSSTQITTDPMSLPALSSYLGEVRQHPGLEAYPQSFSVPHPRQSSKKRQAPPLKQPGLKQPGPKQPVQVLP